MKPPRAVSITQRHQRGFQEATHENRMVKTAIENLEQVNKVLSNISFGEVTNNQDPSQNIEGWYASVTSPAVADTEFAVPHQLGRVPNGFFVLSKTTSGVVYKSATAWTSSNIYLKDSSISDVLLLFIV